MSTAARLANAAGYQLVWFCAVAGAGRGLAWIGPVALLLFAVPTLACSADRSRDLRRMLACVGVGLVLEGLFGASGWLRYAAPLPWSAAAPVWIVSIWAAFGLTIDRSLGYLRGRLLMSALLGAVAAPLAYASAARGFDALAFGAPTAWVLAAIAAAWAVAAPVLLCAGSTRRATPLAGGAAA